MARSEWVRKGRIPLQTITANIEYYNDVAQTKYGLLGIKVWIYKESDK
jgi:small subunit ribosomal protein S3